MPSHYPLIDAHTHLGSDSERSERQKKQILSLVCASTPPEAEALLKTAKPYLLPTAGLHPWQAASYFVNDMLALPHRLPGYRGNRHGQCLV